MVESRPVDVYSLEMQGVGLDGLGFVCLKISGLVSAAGPIENQPAIFHQSCLFLAK